MKYVDAPPKPSPRGACSHFPLATLLSVITLKF